MSERCRAIFVRVCPFGCDGDPGAKCPRKLIHLLSKSGVGFGGSTWMHLFLQICHFAIPQSMRLVCYWQRAELAALKCEGSARNGGSMRKWFALAGLVAIGTIAISTHGFEALSDPWMNKVTIEKVYRRNGNIACEAPINRRRTLHGWRVVYDDEGRVTSEVLYEHGEWLISRNYDHKTGLLQICDARLTPPLCTDDPIPREYCEYRRNEKRLELKGAE